MAVGTGWRGCLSSEAACPQGLCLPGMEMLGPVKWHTVGAQDTWRASVLTQLAPQVLRSTS